MNKRLVHFFNFLKPNAIIINLLAYIFFEKSAFMLLILMQTFALNLFLNILKKFLYNIILNIRYLYF